jgi:cytochrome c-type biogenesis protein CcsB
VSVFLKRFDEISYRLILFSYPFLTLGILSGSVWANETWGSYWSWDPKETWSFITWLIFASYFHQRLKNDTNDKHLSILARGGFRSVWISYLGVNMVGVGLHSYGWFS